MGTFVQRGGQKSPGSGRTRGVKNKLSHKFITALAEDFEEHGVGVIKICRVEKPHEYLKMIAGLMPREFEINNTYLTEVPDVDLDNLITIVEARLAEFIGSPAERESPAINGSEIKLLQPV
jgi:hypothetical protein